MEENEFSTKLFAYIIKGKKSRQRKKRKGKKVSGLFFLTKVPEISDVLCSALQAFSLSRYLFKNTFFYTTELFSFAQNF